MRREKTYVCKEVMRMNVGGWKGRKVGLPMDGIYQKRHERKMSA